MPVIREARFLVNDSGLKTEQSCLSALWWLTGSHRLQVLL